MALTLGYFTAIQRLFVTLDGKVGALLQLFKIEQVGYHFVNHKLFLFLFRQVFMGHSTLFLFNLFDNLLGMHRNMLCNYILLSLQKVRLKCFNMFKRFRVTILIKAVITKDIEAG